MAFMPSLLLVLMICLFQVLSGSYFAYVSGQCLDDQRLKLLEFKGKLQFNSSYSNKLVHWDQSMDCCTWHGVSCDDFGHVSSLELDEETISLQTKNWKILFTLKHLEHLNLAFNNFNSINIPKEICDLSKLKYLNLSNAGFIGQIPICLSRMKSLISLDLSTRFPEIGVLEAKNPGFKALFENLIELRELYLDSVDISAQGIEWCNVVSSLSKLQVLSLSSCNLSGPIHSSLLKLRFSLSIIRLDNNNLATKVPEFFANFTNLKMLSLVSCNLHGHFPEKIFQIRTLESLDLSWNELIMGSLPQFLNNGSFRTLLLPSTNFSGSLRESIHNLRALSEIDLSNCNFSGPIPSTIANLTELVYLDFSENKFNGSIPSFQMSRKLAYIDLDRNMLTGSISSNFEGLKNLEYINLGHNFLSGTIPPSLFALPQLKYLRLSDNQFDGQVDEFPNASSSLLTDLDLSSNFLKGSIPNSFFKLNRLYVLSLSFNFFTGIIKLEMFNKLQNFTRLELSYNNLTVDATISNSSSLPFPQFSILKLASCNLKMFPYLKNQKQMIHLDLSSNHITGEIPNWIWETGLSLKHLNLSCNLLENQQKPYNLSSYLIVLDLHANKFQGDIPIPPAWASYVDYSSNYFNNSIPPDFGNFITTPIFLSLANNNISGQIPESFCKAQYLRVLDLSNNSLSGQIPACLLEQLDIPGVLNLAGNNLHGTIPNTFQENCSLRTLDLSRNKLEGKIPESLANCKLLEVLNIGSNDIEDTFPCTLTKSSNLRVMVLRSNRFHGEIRCSWANQIWENLQIMDIARNNLSGVLPPELFLNWMGMKIEDGNLPSVDNNLEYEILELSQLYYQDTVALIIKGMERQLAKISTIFKTIDFSCNNFRGAIPDTVGELNALYILNLSQNSFSGTIPASIGNLTQLESLDLSMNQLRGRIPMQLGGLTSLSFLDLSYNQLVGEIPGGHQLQTFTDSSFLGNTGLCGFPLNLSCSDSEANGSSPQSPFERLSAKNGIEWEYVLGFSLGLGIISWLNYFSPLWWKKFNALVLQFLLRILHQPVEQRSYRNPIRRL
ncbi:hypothetical protein ACH5RR_003460 [Cinchona calisaya]|uniref:Leucine-rich repeat-containing N-terminal plant-type domain-containing protein n=1 Tax=Cinchona calisaya TaxID=153742 RepID=A0ABD3AUY3_9GENT